MESWVKPLLIRADASAQIGTGHVMRCSALGQAWQDTGGRVVFLMATGSLPLEARLQSEGMEVVHLPVQPGSADDAVQTADYARQVGADWVVVDGYHFGADYQRTIKDSGLRLLFIDDIGHAGHYSADLVLNQNIHAHEGLYPHREPYTRLLLGTRYVLLRREFLKWQGWKREIAEVARKILVTMGGSDPDNVTLKVIRALQQVEVDGLKAVVVVGGSNPHYEELRSAIGESRFSIRLESNVKDMPELMAWADVAVSAGGSTCWELAYMGLPNLILILSNNQHPIAERLEVTKTAINLGWHRDVSPSQIAQAVRKLSRDSKIRAQMSQRAQGFVDGEGVARVLMSLMGEKFRLRRVREDDCRLIWEWANDPGVRVVSFSPEPIPWEKHVQWFESKLGDPYCLFLIALNGEDAPVGQIRFDVGQETQEAVVSVSVDQKYRGKGYGSTLIRMASRRLFDLFETKVIHAYIKPENIASIQAFARAGYKKAGMTEVHGHQALHMVFQEQEENQDEDQGA
jgi:UDP-2,4-diacetamido-2,4,6-trideoxy-beta-L-altropyranose hydrolase